MGNTKHAISHFRRPRERARRWRALSPGTVRRTSAIKCAPSGPFPQMTPAVAKRELQDSTVQGSYFVPAFVKLQEGERVLNYANVTFD